MPLAPCPSPVSLCTPGDWQSDSLALKTRQFLHRLLEDQMRTALVLLHKEILEFAARYVISDSSKRARSTYSHIKHAEPTSRRSGFLGTGFSVVFVHIQYEVHKRSFGKQPQRVGVVNRRPICCNAPVLPLIQTCSLKPACIQKIPTQGIHVRAIQHVRAQGVGWSKKNGSKPWKRSGAKLRVSSVYCGLLRLCSLMEVGRQA